MKPDPFISLQLIPRDGFDAAAQPPGFADSANDESSFGLGGRRSFFEKEFDMTRIARHRAVGPFDLDGDNLLGCFNDEIHFRASHGAPESDAMPRSEQFDAVHELKSDPLREERSTLQAQQRVTQREPGRGIAHPEIEEKE